MDWSWSYLARCVSPRIPVVCCSFEIPQIYTLLKGFGSFEWLLLLNTDNSNKMNEWMNGWCIYIALLLCIAIHPKHFTIMWGVSPQPPPVCSIHLDDATADTGQQRQCAHHTPATGGEEREIEPIKWMGIIRRPWLIRASGGNLARTPGLHPYSFTRSVMGFLMTTEIQDLGLTSHLKDGAFYSIVSPSLYWGVRTHTDHRVSTPCWPH